MSLFDSINAPVQHTPEANRAAMAGAINLDAAGRLGDFTDAFKKSWSSGERILPGSLKAAGKQFGVGALAGAGIAAYQQKDITAPASIGGVSTMAIGGGAVVGGLMAWKFGKRLKTSIFTGLGEKKAAKEAAQEVGQVLSGEAKFLPHAEYE